MPGNQTSWFGLLVHNGQVICSSGILGLNCFSGTRSQKDPVSGMFACFGKAYITNIIIANIVAADQCARCQFEHFKFSQYTMKQVLLLSIFTEKETEVQTSLVTGPRLHSQSVKELGFKPRQSGSRVPTSIYQQTARSPHHKATHWTFKSSRSLM